MSRTSMLQQQLQLLVKALLARSPAYVWRVPLWKARPASCMAGQSRPSG